jgi:amino acid transporter/nucleotide-binding universal stress UspA family protein
VVIATLAVARGRGVAAPPGLLGFLIAAGLATAVLVVLLGATLVFRPEGVTATVDLGRAPSLFHLALACSLAAVFYTGIESVGRLVGEAREPDARVSRAAVLLVATAVALALGASAVALMAMPVHRGAGGGITTALAHGAPAGFAGAPLQGIAARLPLRVLATGMQSYLGLVAATGLVIAVAAAAGAAVRLVISLARHYQLPSAVVRADPRSGAPVVTTGLVGVAAAALLLPGLSSTDELRFLAALAVLGAMLAVTITQAGIIVLRWKEPDRHRPIRVRGNVRIHGRALPVPTMLCAVATAAAGVLALLLSTSATAVGVVWMAAGVAGSATYRRRHGLGLTDRRDRAIAARSGPEVEVEFRSILIPVNADQLRVPRDMIEVAAKLAAEQRAAIVLLIFLQIPLSEEIDVEIPDEEAVVSRLVEQARKVAAAYGIRVHATHLRTRDPAEAILAEARRRNAEIILLGATGRHRATFRGYARDAVTRQVVGESPVRVMFIQPEPSSR